MATLERDRHRWEFNQLRIKLAVFRNSVNEKSFLIKLRTLRKEKQKINEKKSKMKLILTFFILLLIIIILIYLIYKNQFSKIFNEYKSEINNLFVENTINNTSFLNELNLCKCMNSTTIRERILYKYEEQIKNINFQKFCDHKKLKKTINLKLDYQTLEKCEEMIEIKLFSDFLICYRQNYNELYEKEKNFRNLKCN